MISETVVTGRTNEADDSRLSDPILALSNILDTVDMPPANTTRPGDSLRDWTNRMKARIDGQESFVAASEEDSQRGALSREDVVSRLAKLPKSDDLRVESMFLLQDFPQGSVLELLKKLGAIPENTPSYQLDLDRGQNPNDKLIALLKETPGALGKRQGDRSHYYYQRHSSYEIPTTSYTKTLEKFPGVAIRLEFASQELGNRSDYLTPFPRSVYFSFSPKALANTGRSQFTPINR